MDSNEFRLSLAQPAPPDGLNSLLLALWHAGRGDWDKAHALAQDIATRDGAWVHAHLHRQEGDLGNASYWYNRAGRPMTSESIDSEWTALASTLLSNKP